MSVGAPKDWLGYPLELLPALLCPGLVLVPDMSPEALFVGADLSTVGVAAANFGVSGYGES